MIGHLYTTFFQKITNTCNEKYVQLEQQKTCCSLGSNFWKPEKKVVFEPKFSDFYATFQQFWHIEVKHYSV